MAQAGTDAGYGEFRAHWPVLAPAMAGVMLCAVHGYSLGVMIGPIEREFGWSRAQISSGMTIIAFIALVAAPLVGLAVDRFGPRRIGLFGIAFYCASLALLGMATDNIASWWGLWVLLAIGNMFILPTVWTAAINGYFERRRGLALAIALCGTGISAAIVPSLANLLIEQGGWRFAYAAMAGILAAVNLPLAWFLFHAAGDARSTGGKAAAQSGGVSAREGFRSPRFVKLAGAAAIFSIAICALTTNAVPVLMAGGLGSAAAAATAGLVGIGSIIGRLGGGYLLDRLDASWVAAGSVMAPIVTVAILLFADGSTTAAAVACLVLGLAVGVEVDACAYLAARHFGLKAFGALFGAINGLLLFGAGIAPMAANWVYDVTTSYDIVLWAQVPACVAAAVLFLALGPYPRFDDEAAPVPEPGRSPAGARPAAT